MTELLSRIFIKNHNDTSSQLVRKSYGTMAGIVGIITNFLLATAKIILGVFIGSVAITADALNNLSDAGSSLITLFSFKIAAKPADKAHPFGHARMEYIASMVVSFLILLVGAEMMIDSVELIFNPPGAAISDMGTITATILLISIVLKLWLAAFYNRIGKKISSSVVRAAATDSLSDCISTTAVLISSIIINLTGWYILDAIIGAAVSVVIIIAGGRILIETKNSLLGEAPVQETIDNIKSIVSKYPQVIGMHDLMVHNYGPTHFIASFHAEVDGKENIYQLHDAIDNLERDIKNELDIACTIHMDPIVTDDEEVTGLREMLEETLKELDFNFGVHDFRVVVGDTHTNLIFDIALPFEYKKSEAAIVSEIEAAVKSKRPECYCVITVDRE